MFESGDLRKGLKLELDGEPYVIVQFEFVKPGKGQALYKCKLKNMLTGAQFDKTFRSGEKFKEANLEEVEMEYLYSDGDQLCFMNTNTCSVLLFEGRTIGISLPFFIDLLVKKTAPWVKGDTASGDSKPATLETGYVLNVPPFIQEGELIRIDTRTGEYVERVKT
jgi:elongation factor P